MSPAIPLGASAGQSFAIIPEIYRPGPPGHTSITYAGHISSASPPGHLQITQAGHVT